MAFTNPILVLGGHSLIAPYLINRLADEGLTAEVLSRHPLGQLPEGFKATTLDLNGDRDWVAAADALAISLIPIRAMVRFLPRLMGVRSIIALSAANIFAADHEGGYTSGPIKELSDNYRFAENIFHTWCARGTVACTLIRPAMVYDGTHDRTIARIGGFIRRFRFFPLAGEAKGLRQPIHADDAAAAIMGALGNAAAYGKTLNIGGNELLTCRAMITRVFEALGHTPRFIPWPASWIETPMLWAVQSGMVPLTDFLPEVFLRMNDDLVFDTQEGLKILKYSPRLFDPGTKPDLDIFSGLLST